MGVEKFDFVHTLVPEVTGVGPGDWDGTLTSVIHGQSHLYLRLKLNVP